MRGFLGDVRAARPRRRPLPDRDSTGPPGAGATRPPPRPAAGGAGLPTPYVSSACRMSGCTPAARSCGSAVHARRVPAPCPHGDGRAPGSTGRFGSHERSNSVRGVRPAAGCRQARVVAAPGLGRRRTAVRGAVRAAALGPGPAGPGRGPRCLPHPGQRRPQCRRGTALGAAAVGPDPAAVLLAAAGPAAAGGGLPGQHGQAAGAGHAADPAGLLLPHQLQPRQPGGPGLLP